MYSIEIFDRTWTSLLGYIRTYSWLQITRKLSDISRVSFGIPQWEESSTPEILQKKNQVVLKKWWKIFRKGIIQLCKPESEKIQVECSDLMELYRARYINEPMSWNLWDIIRNIHNISQSQWNVYIDNVDVVTDKQWTFEFVNKNAIEAIKEVWNNWLEMYVFSNTLIVRDNVWTIKQNPLFYNEFYPVGNNIDSPDIEENWKEIRNIVKSKGRDALVSEKSDQASIDKYGPLINYVTFDTADNQSTLDQMTQEYLDQYKEQDISVKFDLIVKEEWERDDYFLWDYVNVSIKKWYNNIVKTMRIVWIQYNVKWKSSMPWVSFELSDTKTASKNLFEDISDMKKRIIDIEKRIV